VAGVITVASAGCATTAPPAQTAVPPVGVAVSPNASGVPIPGSLTWSDEFDGPAGSAPDPGRWGHDLGGEWNREELQYYTSNPENVALDGQGNLVITARRDHTEGRQCRSGPCEFSSARLTTAGIFTQLYGTFEARIKLPVAPGLLPAFWMVGDDIGTVGWPQSGEIDIVEHPGLEPNQIYGSVHGPGLSKGSPYKLPRGRSFNDDFHTFSMRWTPSSINFFVDGVWYGRHTPESVGRRGWVFDHPFFIVLNLAVGGEWAGDPGNRTEFPEQRVVDYVRVYSWDAKPG